MCGRVVTAESSPDFAGARHHSNNTGEITALIKATDWIISFATD
jgi:hypothetical protein